MSSTITALTSGGGLAMAGDTSGQLELKTNNGTTAVTVDTSQNVGIGTGSPSRKLTVYATGSSVPAVITNDQTQARICFKDSVTALDYTVGIGSIGENLASYTGGTERMRIDSSGNLLVGKTSKNNTSGNGFQCEANGTVNVVTASSTSSFDTYEIYSTGAGAYRFYVTAGGVINATSTSITGISDQRLKENIVDLDDGLDSVLALKPRKFDWKENKGKGIKGDRGFIAQEFATVFPDMIEEWKDPAPEGEEPYKAINANLIPTLVKAIQELNAKVDAQAATITALQAKVGN